MFAAYAAQSSSAVARGGRYDEVGKAFGRARPAIGFSIDLRELARNRSRRPSGARDTCARRRAIRRLRALISQLRAAGEVVVQRREAKASAPKRANAI